MALQNNIDSRIDQLNVDVAGARVRYSWGAFDPALNFNGSRDSIQQAQNPSLITTAAEVTQQSNILAQQSNLIVQERALLEQQIFINAVIQSGIGGSLPISQVPTLSLPQTSTQQNPLIFQSEAWRASADLRGKLPLGTTYGFSLNTSRVEHQIFGFNQQFFPDNTAFAGITVDQPLLRDFGFGANLAEVRINRKNKQIARLTWEQKVIEAVQNVILTYYEMVHALEVVQVKEEGIAAAHKLVEGNQRRFDLDGPGLTRSGFDAANDPGN